MWAITNTSNNLKFYCFENKEFMSVATLKYKLDKFGYVDKELEDHNVVLQALDSAGIRVFIDRKEAKEHITSEKITGFKYLELNPTIL
jgi:hypothetical protein